MDLKVKDIRECFLNTPGFSQYLYNRDYEETIDEGLKELFTLVKDKFKQAYQYIKGIVVKVGSYFVTIGNDGQVQPCISPLTAGQAYKDGRVNKSTTLVILDKEGSRIVGLNTKPEQAKALYGSGNSIKYWERMVHESSNNEQANVNEVKMHTEDPQAKYSIVCDDEMLKKQIKMVLKN